MDSHRNEGPSEGVRETSTALREWSAGLRAWSECARLRSRTARAQAVRRRRDVANEPPRQILAVPVQEADAAATAGSALGTVTVEELRTALVDHHGLSENEAAAAVGLELLCAGYPPGDDWVTGADGIDMVHTIVRRRQERL